MIPNSQITTVANQSIDYSVATVNVHVDYSANPDKVMELLKGIAMEVRNSEEFRAVFVADPQDSGGGLHQGFRDHLPGCIQDAGNETVCPGAGVSSPCSACTRREQTAARRSKQGV